MIRFQWPSWRFALAFRIGIAVVLCANCSCRNAEKMTNHDPFSHAPPQAQASHAARASHATHAAHGHGDEFVPTEGNHEMLAASGIPLKPSHPASQVKATPNMAGHPQAQQQAKYPQMALRTAQQPRPTDTNG